MSNYSTQTLIEKKLGKSILLDITDKEDAGEIDTAEVTDKLSKADSLIHSYVSARYSASVPFNPVPPIIEDFATDIAVYLLYKDSYMGVPDARQKEYDAALSWLKDVQNGDALIDGVAFVKNDQRKPGETFYDTDRERVMTRSNLTGM